jgi:predicted membrane-bound spermidine synthase
MALVAAEGFTSLAFEVIALRRIVPYVGSSITVTAPTIAIFLAALALGYFAAARVAKDYETTVLRNFVIAAAVGGTMLSSAGAALVFGLVPYPPLALVIYLCVSMAPPAYFLAQTVPVLSNIVGRERAGDAGGVTLAASTAGSVVGALVLSLIVMQWLGVRAALLVTALGLLTVALWGGLATGRRRLAWQAALVALPIVVMNVLPAHTIAESAYADYQVRHGSAPGHGGAAVPMRQLVVNNQVASQLGGAGLANRAPYIEFLSDVLTRQLALDGQQILVLGAGGFTLSLGDARNTYTFVDIDPMIRAVAQRHFLPGSPNGRIQGSFVADDARNYVVQSDKRFAAIVVDVYSSHVSVPAHLVTLEFWQSLSRRLEPGGTVLANLVLEPSLRSPYARNVLATVQQALGACAVHVLNQGARLSNVAVVCRDVQAAAAQAHVYTDDLNGVDWDRNIRGH